MQNHKKQDKLFVNKISETNEVKQMSGKPVGDAAKEPFCVFGHERHAVGSKIINRDGSESVCQADSTWKDNSSSKL